MSVFEQVAENDHEQVIFCHDSQSGLRAIICIHNTVLGPAVGGCRMWKYATEEEALVDALRLARGMTYKSALAGLNLGGGKAVIIGDPKRDKSEPLLRSFGRFVQGLAGRYLTAEDVGTNVRDMEVVRMETDFVYGISRSLGGSGDPSPVTALGVFEGIKACAKRAWGDDSLAEKVIAIQGVGHVGYHLCQHLHREGAIIKIADIDPENLRRAAESFEVEVVGKDEIYGTECDIFAPCALGGVLDDQTIPQLRCSIVAGCANNQLADEMLHSKLLADRAILYAPDYVINAGGLINVANELVGYDRERAVQQAAGVYEILLNIFAHADSEMCTTIEAANAMAERRISDMSNVTRTYVGTPRRQRGWR